MIILRSVYDEGNWPLVEAVDILYQLLAERPQEANISHQGMPNLRQHTRFVKSRPYLAWYVIQDGAAAVGAIYLTKCLEVGIAIFRGHQRKGYASQAIAELRRRHPGRLLANVAPGNERSHALFRKLGGRLIQVTYEL